MKEVHVCMWALLLIKSILWMVIYKVKIAVINSSKEDWWPSFIEEQNYIWEVVSISIMNNYSKYFLESQEWYSTQNGVFTHQPHQKDLRLWHMYIMNTAQRAITLIHFFIPHPLQLSHWFWGYWLICLCKCCCLGEVSFWRSSKSWFHPHCSRHWWRTPWRNS